MFKGRRKLDQAQPRLISGSTKIPADGKTPVILKIEFPNRQQNTVTLSLSRGSFIVGKVVSEQQFTLIDGIAEVTIHPTHRPTAGYLTGDGLRLKLGFVPANFTQKLLVEWLPIIVGALLFTLFLRTYAFASFFIPTASMENTVAVGDLVLSWNAGYQLLGDDLDRGDIIVFDHPDPEHVMWIKRVIGLPGDVVESYGGQVIVNGRPLFEPYIKNKSYFNFGPVIVQPDEYFVMGDNRNNSNDSRFWGCLHKSRIKGRAAIVYWPLNHSRVIMDE